MEDVNQQLFFSLLQAGLWNKEVRSQIISHVDWTEVYKIASEQSVVGLVAAGLDRFKKADVQESIVPQSVALTFASEVLQLEQRNTAMNTFLGVLIKKLRGSDIYSLLLKGQGVAQYYEKPLWRACGDIDLFLSAENYVKAKDYLSKIAIVAEKEIAHRKHIGLSLDGWLIELHGRLECGLSKRIDKTLEYIQRDTFYNGGVRSQDIDGVQVFMLSAENDVFYVFVHFLNHFYKGGIGLRQICDWCRLLWTFRDSLDYKLLEQRIRRAGLMSEWKAFYTMATKYLGMPDLKSSFISQDSSNLKWEKKADRIMEFVMMSGNFGHNRDTSYYRTKPFVVRKAISFWVRLKDLYHHARIFPLDSIRFFWGITVYGLKAVVRGE